MLDASQATWPEVAAHQATQPIALLAVGAQEQHGPHLPLNTDTLLAHELARRLAQALDALLLPPIAYGDAWNNEGFAGTLSISFDTLRALVLDLGRGAQRMGYRALLLVNGHFGNRAALELAARALCEQGISVLLLDYPGLAEIAAAVCESPPAAPTFYHADEVETSMMLACAPELVHLDRAVAEYPPFPPTFGAEPLDLSTFNQSGVFGDPRPATAAKGERIFAALTANCLTVIRPFLARHNLD